MGMLTELRGALGGGVAAITWGVGTVPASVSSRRVRVVQGKRQVLSDELVRRLQAGGSLGRGTTAFVGHTRYPTSSRSVESELHPHLWSPHAKAPHLWFAEASAEGDALPCAPAPRANLRGLYLCHNGDFDEYDLFGQRVTYDLAGRWVGRVLHHHDACVGDSPKVAGMLEVLATKGDWAASVRLAFQRVVAASAADAAAGDALLGPDAPNACPSPKWCELLGAKFAALWRSALTARARAVVADAEAGLPTAAAAFERAFLDEAERAAPAWLAEDSPGGAPGAPPLVPEDKRAQFARVAVEKFWRADLFAAMVEFMTRAHGSFGLQVISCIDPNAVVIAAKGQTMRLAVVPTARLALWGSEGSAVLVPVAGHDTRFVLRLDSIKGQVVQVRRTAHSHVGASALPCELSAHAAGWDCFALKSFHLDRGLEDSGAVLRQLQRVSLAPAQPQAAAFKKAAAVEPVLADIRAASGVLDRIVTSWRENPFNTASRNRRSGKSFVACFAKALAANAQAPGFLASRGGGGSGGGSGNPLHLLVVGIEVSLFVAEQFAADVMEFIPGSNALAVSSNQVVGGDKVYFSARDSKGSLSLSTLSETDTVVLVVSQSGQTFPSLKSTARLVERLGDRVFVLVGGTDETAASTEMGCVVMDYHKRSGRDGSDHIFSNLSGPRPCEPSSVAVVATHQTLTELLITLRLGLEGNAAVAQAQPLLRDLLIGPDKELREGFRSAVAALTAPALANVASIVGCTASGYVTEGGARGDALRGRAIGQQPLGAEHGEGVHAELVALGRRWGRHVSEPWRLMFLTGAYVAAAVTFGVPLFRTAYFVLAKLAGIPYDACSGGVSAFILGGSDPNACSAGFVVLGTALAALDSALFIFFPVLAGRLLRAWEGRALMHRFGKRTVVVADVPWVSRCTEQFGSRVFALSYGFACPEFHTADPVDDLIHRFGHRSVRGLLLLVGRPDGRLFAFTKTESAVLLSCKQMSFVENLGENPENRPRFLDEFLYERLWSQRKNQGAVDSLSFRSPRHILMSIRKALMRQRRSGAESESSRSVFGLNAVLDMSTSLDHSVYSNAIDLSDGRLKRLVTRAAPSGEAAGAGAARVGHELGEVALSPMGAAAAAAAGAAGAAPRRPLGSLQEEEPPEHAEVGSDDDAAEVAPPQLPAHSPELLQAPAAALEVAQKPKSGSARAGGKDSGSNKDAEPADTSLHAPREASAFQANLDERTDQVLSKFVLHQRLLEARFNSLERFVSFCVVFQAAAEATNEGLWGLPRWDLSRSQSHMRINSTACPILEGSGDDAGLLERTTLLRGVPLFARLPQRVLELVAGQAVVVDMASGSALAQPSSASASASAGARLVVIKSGEAASKDGGRRFGAGDHFGADGLLRGDAECPDAVFARGAVTCLVLKRKAFLKVCEALQLEVAPDGLLRPCQGDAWLFSSLRRNSSSGGALGAVTDVDDQDQDASFDIDGERKTEEQF